MYSVASDVPWNTEQEEFFTLLVYRFDVRKAKRMLAASDRLIHEVRVSDVAGWVDWFSVPSDGPANLGVPVIVAELGAAGNVIIDGWHRVRSAVGAGVGALPAVVLSADEAVDILVNRGLVHTLRKVIGGAK